MPLDVQGFWMPASFLTCARTLKGRQRRGIFVSWVSQISNSLANIHIVIRHVEEVRSTGPTVRRVFTQ